MTENNGTPDESSPGPVFNPQSGFPTLPGQEPQQPAYGQPFPQQPYPQQPAYGQPYPQQPFAQQPGYPAYGQPFAYAAPNHPRATTALVLGLISVVGGLMCLLPVLASPFAWFTGVKARREIRQSNGQLGGDGMATAGMVLGIIGTVLLALGLILIVVLVIVAVNDPNAFDESGTV